MNNWTLGAWLTGFTYRKQSFLHHIKCISCGQKIFLKVFPIMIMEAIIAKSSTSVVFGKFEPKRHVWQYQLCMGLQAVGLMVSEKKIFKCFPIFKSIEANDSRGHAYSKHQGHG